MRIRNQIIDIEDRLLLTEVLKDLGYKVSTGEGFVLVPGTEEDFSQEFLDSFIDMTPEELKEISVVKQIKEGEIRVDRNKKLEECDYVVLPDSDASQDCKDAFAVYRQSLRDLVNEVDFNPFDFTWPEKPEYVKGE